MFYREQNCTTSGVSNAERKLTFYGCTATFEKLLGCKQTSNCYPADLLPLSQTDPHGI